ncbi:outer membrane porin HofQ [Kluyvera cryocrescens]|uniref:Outer membrane porin HofQ n=1 Tax=Kluyvera cryocrescens TaxID=580 RepID=A0A485AR68_KLUCR|nr:outer membrane porin HofQ [Kluyvera cryocrescens]
MTVNTLALLLHGVHEMDIPVGQVELAAHIVTINETSLRELGVKWNLADAEGKTGSGKITTLNSDLSVADATTHAGFNIGRINGRLLELELSALEQKQKVDIIASPDCWHRICSRPVSNRGARFPIRYRAVKVERPRWSLRRRCSVWR